MINDTHSPQVICKFTKKRCCDTMLLSFNLLKSQHKRMRRILEKKVAIIATVLLLLFALTSKFSGKTCTSSQRGARDENRNYNHLKLDGRLTDGIAHTRYREEILPLALMRFDWILYDNNAGILKRDRLPKYVFCLAHKTAIDRLANEYPKDFRGSVLLVGGEDLHLSEALETTNLNALVANFDIVRYEAKDIDSDAIDTFPMGLLPHYTRKHDEFKIRDAIVSASLKSKPNLLLAAWGKVWPHLDEIPSRREADEFLDSVTWTARSDVEIEQWWSTLKLHKFMLCPTGNGIQSPKFVEAFLTLTIPIVQNESAYFDLYQQGFPLLIVKSWDELSPSMLEGHWERLSPRLAWARSQFLTDQWYSFVTRVN